METWVGSHGSTVLVALGSLTLGALGRLAWLPRHAAKAASRAANVLREKSELERALATEQAASEHYRNQLEHADRLSTLGTAVAQIAHEINNPLTFVALTLPRFREILPKAGEEVTAVLHAELFEMLHDIEEGTGRVLEIANDLKLFSVRRTSEDSLVDLEEIAQASLRMLRSVVPERARVELLHEAAPAVFASRVRLIQVVLNLLRNALEALPKGGADNVVRVVTGSHPNGGAFLRVEDNGAGIPANVLPLVFEPFFTTKSDSGGTGLGLAVSREIVYGLNGTIDVQSGILGTVFEIVMPSAEVQLGRGAGRSLPAIGDCP